MPEPQASKLLADCCRWFAFRVVSLDDSTERTTIEWFVGGHQINAKETFAFLKKHLDYPK